jgi:hypothetical protein
MKRSQALTLTLLLAGLSLTACGRRAPGVTPDVPVTQPPAITTPQAPLDSTPIAAPPVTMPTDPSLMPNQPSQAPNPALSQFNVDQDSMLNDWQARGIAVSGGSIYVAAVDVKGLLKKGTVVKMDASTGKNWKNLGSSLMGLKHTLDDNLQSVTFAGGNLFALDSSLGLYSVSTNGGQVKALKGAGGMDLAGTNNGIFIAANGTLERSDMSGASRAPLPGLGASAGVGSNSRGEVFFIAGGRVAMLDMNGRPRELMLQGLNNALDVAGDGRTGDVYVLEQGGIKRFSMSGQLLSSFPHNATQPQSIAIDESGNVYVSDFGSSPKDSKIIKFGPPAGMPQNPGMGYGDPYAGNNGYGGGYGSTPAYGGGYGNGYPDPYAGNNGYGTGYGNPYGTGYGSAPAYGNPYGSAPTYGTYAAPQTQTPAVAPATTSTGRRY